MAPLAAVLCGDPDSAADYGLAFDGAGDGAGAADGVDGQAGAESPPSTIAHPLLRLRERIARVGAGPAPGQ